LHPLRPKTSVNSVTSTGPKPFSEAMSMVSIMYIWKFGSDHGSGVQSVVNHNRSGPVYPIE